MKTHQVDYRKHINDEKQNRTVHIYTKQKTKHKGETEGRSRRKGEWRWRENKKNNRKKQKKWIIAKNKREKYARKNKTTTYVKE